MKWVKVMYSNPKCKIKQYGMRGCGICPIYGSGMFLLTMHRGVPGHSPQSWYISHIPQTPEVPYCYYKLVTNVISAVKLNVLSNPWYTVCNTMAVSHIAFRAGTTQFIIVNNGYIAERFQLSRGVKQGCPLSAYQFIIAIKNVKIRSNNNIKGLEIQGLKTKLSLNFLLNPQIESFHSLIEDLDTFSNLSRLKPNYDIVLDH